MATILFSDNTYGTLASGITAAAVSITLTTGHGARFPTVTLGTNILYAVILNSGNVLEEIHITAHAASSDTLTVTRAANGTTGKVWSAGDRIECRLTSEHFAHTLFDSGLVANLAMAGFKLTGMGNGSLTDDSMAYGQRAKFKIGTTTHDVSVAGTQDVTGIGFTPTAVVLLAGVTGTSQMSVGFDNGTNAYAIGDNAGLSAGTYNMSVISSIYGRVGVSDIFEATVTAYASGQFTLTWTKSGSPTGTATVHYLAIGY